MSAELLQCYNKGCGKKFREEENNEGQLEVVHELVLWLLCVPWDDQEYKEIT